MAVAIFLIPGVNIFAGIALGVTYGATFGAIGGGVNSAVRGEGAAAIKSRSLHTKLK